MSVTPKFLQGKSGVVEDQVLAGVIHMFWSRGRAAWGEEVVAGALLSGWEDGTDVKLKVYPRGAVSDEREPETVLEGQLEGGFIKATWELDYQGDEEEGGEYEMIFLVEIDGETLTDVAQSPVLFLDMLPPEFSI